MTSDMSSNHENAPSEGSPRAPERTDLAPNAALIVVDVQRGFEEEEFWGPRDNPAADENIAALIDAWQETGRPVVFVRHDSSQPGSPLRPGYGGNDFKEYVRRRRGQGTRSGAAGDQDRELGVLRDAGPWRLVR